jgi:hypothetical protein
MRRRVAVLGLLLAAAGCSWDGSSSATETAVAVSSAPAGGTSTAIATRARALPARVARTRAEIVRAAHAFDYRALRELIRPGVFIYSFEESGDPIGFWRRLETEAEVPVLGDILPVVLSTRPLRQEGAFVWPAAALKKVPDWTTADVAGIERIYGPGAGDRFRNQGSYTGWRASIRDDGLWLFFVTSEPDY